MGKPTVDSGHEMYVPTVLAEGKTLYKDVWFMYFPAAPYFNSLFVPFVRRAFERAVSGGIIFGARIGDISLPHGNAAGVLGGRLDGRSSVVIGSIPTIVVLFPAALQFQRGIRVPGGNLFLVDDRSCLQFEQASVDVRSGNRGCGGDAAQAGVWYSVLRGAWNDDCGPRFAPAILENRTERFCRRTPWFAVVRGSHRLDSVPGGRRVHHARKLYELADVVFYQDLRQVLARVDGI